MRNMIDLQGFLYSLHTYGIYAFKDAIIRRITSTLLSSIHSKRVPMLLERIDTMVSSNESFLLIVLDSCRYDVFSFFASRFFKGCVNVVKSEGSFLPNWIPSFLSIISRKTPVRVFRAICKIKPHNIRLASFCSDIKEVEVIEGVDDLCSRCPMLAAGACKFEEEVREMDAKALEALGLSVGDRVRMEEVREKLKGLKEWLDDFCEGCEFQSACEREKEAFFSPA